MIRRCTGKTSAGTRCGMSEGHKSKYCHSKPETSWCCGCGDVKPAELHGYCGACGGADGGKRRRGVQPPRFGKAQDKAMNERRAKIARLMARRRG